MVPHEQCLCCLTNSVGAASLTVCGATPTVFVLSHQQCWCSLTNSLWCHTKGVCVAGAGTAAVTCSSSRRGSWCTSWRPWRCSTARRTRRSATTGATRTTSSGGWGSVLFKYRFIFYRAFGLLVKKNIVKHHYFM